MFKFFTVMMLGKLVKIFNYLCLALFGTIDGNMFFFFETWWKHVPTERRIMGRNELHGIDPVHNQPNIIFYCLELILFKNDQKIGMSAPPRLTGSRPGTVQAQEPFLSNQTRPETGSTIHATPISCCFLHPPLLYKRVSWIHATTIFWN